MKHAILRLFIILTVFGVLSLLTQKTTNAGIYGCIWVASNPLGQQCVLDGAKNACLPNEAPSLCDFADQASCNSFNGNCVPNAALTTWGCGSDGKCVLQNQGNFPTQAACTQSCAPKVMWKCVDPTAAIKCQQVFGQTGDATTVNECNAKCTAPPANGNGTPVDFIGKCTATGIPGAKANEGISTAIGCIPIGSGSVFATFILRWGLGIAGGIALLLIVYAGFLIMTSEGDPKRLQSGRELMTSAISGVILIVFSIFVLRLLSVNILGFI